MVAIIVYINITLMIVRWACQSSVTEIIPVSLSTAVFSLQWADWALQHCKSQTLNC